MVSLGGNGQVFLTTIQLTDFQSHQWLGSALSLLCDLRSKVLPCCLVLVQLQAIAVFLKRGVSSSDTPPHFFHLNSCLLDFFQEFSSTTSKVLSTNIPCINCTTMRNAIMRDDMSLVTLSHRVLNFHMKLLETVFGKQNSWSVLFWPNEFELTVWTAVWSCAGGDFTALMDVVLPPNDDTCQSIQVPSSYVLLTVMRDWRLKGTNTSIGCVLSASCLWKKK